MRISKWLSPFLLLIVLATSCGKSAPVLDNFDAALWKSDKYGCRQERMKLYASLSLQKSKLLGLDEMEVVSVLGKPDQSELYTRNQKFYHYFLEPSEKCSVPSPGARRLVLRFNAVGLVKEIGTE